MPVLKNGWRTWKMQRDRQGHRQYHIAHLVYGLVSDGPATILLTPGLPLPGSFWNYGNDVDIWATCQFDASVSIHQEREGDANCWWRVEQTFDTNGSRWPLTNQHNPLGAGDPLLEPMQVSGSFVKERIEALEDRFGAPAKNSAHEQIHGPQVEFDSGNHQVRMRANFAVLGVELWGPMINTLNRFPLWGLPPRCIKLSNVSWERKYYQQALIYYARSYEFDVRFKVDDITGEIVSDWDRDIMDQGTKVLHGHWDRVTKDWILDDINGLPPDPNNPTHFIKATGTDYNPQKILLNGHGVPARVHVVGGAVFASLQDLNQANPVTDEDWWIKINNPGTIYDYSPDPEYAVGDLVTVDDVIYVCLIDNPDLGPLDTVPGGENPRWAELPEYNGVFAPWDEDEIYVIGDLVVPAEDTAIGIKHFEKYEESDFLLLGIPVVFG